MEIELLVQIGILGCLVYIIWTIKAIYELNTINWSELYQKLDEIKDKD